jgi:lysophospholipase L1-like esterase
VESETPVDEATATTAGEGTVSVTSMATFRRGGVALSNLGVSGSQLMHTAREDPEVVRAEFREYRPDLIVLAFGTNEGFSPRVNEFEYEVTLRAQIGRIRRLAGNVPILMLGAPDALSRRAEMRANTTSGEASPDCGAPVAQPAAAEPGVIDTIMTKLRNSIGIAPSEPQSAPGPASPPPPVATGTSKGPLFPPAGLRLVRDVQRRVAAQLNVAFWDWEKRLGGRCYADAWVHANPPLMRGDYVHYTTAGGKEVAQRLEADLDKAMAR